MAKSGLEIFELICLGVVGILTLLGNCLVILAFIFGPRNLRTYTHYFVVNLAISDLMVGCLSIPFWLVYRTVGYIAVSDVYEYFLALDILCGSVSILSLAAISLERLFAVKFTTLHFNMSKLPVLTAILVAWAVGILFTGCKFEAHKISSNNQSLKVYTTFLFIFIFLLPLFIIIGSYCLIIITANKMVKTSKKDGNLVQELHIAKTISVIIGLFVVCWAPFFIINMIYVYCKNSSCIPVFIIYVAKLMHYSNSMMNFFVYAVRSPEFRRTFKRILFRCDCTRVKERIRTMSEVVVTRTRSASERFSFLHDSNHNNENGHYDAKKIREPKRKSRTNYRQSFATEVSVFDENSLANMSDYLSHNGTTSLIKEENNLAQTSRIESREQFISAL